MVKLLWVTDDEKAFLTLEEALNWEKVRKEEINNLEQFKKFLDESYKIRNKFSEAELTYLGGNGGYKTVRKT